MKHILTSFGLIVTLIVCVSCRKTVQLDDYAIIPQPVFMELESHTFTLNRRTKLCFENLPQNTPTAKYITTALRQIHFRPSFTSSVKKDCIIFSLLDTDNVDTLLGNEGYLLQVRPDGIFISANTEAGLFYAFQTLLQMLPDDVSVTRYSRVVMPCCTVVDYPRFSWRGSHLDVCRHFFTVGQVKKHLDLMAAYKLNKFHWHLTDDHGWRIEIDAYPQLNDIGSWRVDRSNVPWGEEKPAQPGEEPSYGGFFSKADVADILDYAAARHIEVIPEIEMPGHCSAILAAYPELACDSFPYTVAIGPYWPPKAILCAGNDKTLEFLCAVLDEVTQMFPSDYLHIGGDEAFKDNWKACPKCQARIRHEHLAGEEELQGWLVAQVAEYLSRKGKRIIGWDEMLDCGEVPADAITMSWRSVDAARRSVQQGHDAILCPTEYCYLDYYQADPKSQPTAIGGYIPLSKAYSFDPMPAGLTVAERHRILGGQANLWSEFINTYDHAEYMLLPRLCALSECFWSPTARKDWEHFQEKIVHHTLRLHAKGYNCCDVRE